MKKVLALILALLMVLAAVSGCSDIPVGDIAADAAGQLLEEILNDEQTVPDGTEPEDQPSDSAIDESGSYDSRDDVALYIHTYGRLPDNYITKDEARDMGWNGGPVEDYAPGCCIGGDRFGNYEGLLPDADGRTWTECDIDSMGTSRGAKRIVFSNDGLIYYTDDHYESFELLYTAEGRE